MIAGAALLVLAAWSPFALLRLIPMMEGAAASVVGQRSAMSAAAGSAGVTAPPPTCGRRWTEARPSSPPAYPTTGGTTYARRARPSGRRLAQIGRDSPDRSTSESPPGEGARARGPAGPRTRGERSTRARAAERAANKLSRSRDRRRRRSRHRLAPGLRLPSRRAAATAGAASSPPARRSRPPEPPPDEARHATEVTHEHRRVSALPIRTARATRTDWVAATGAGDPHRRQPHRRRDPDADPLERHWGCCGLALTLLASAFCFWPIGGRSAEAWLPIVGGTPSGEP